MAVRLNNEIALRDRALSNTWRNRIVAFGPIAVALVGIAAMAVAGHGRGASGMIAADTVDPVHTGSVPAPGSR